MRVIKNLHNAVDAGFTISENWKFGTWRRQLCMPNYNNNKTMENNIHSVDYLINTVSGNVITSQCKAWNDTVRMAMYIDLILKPEGRKKEKIFVWMDNFSAHKSMELSRFYREANVEIGLLPPNMTHILQVMDLVVNGPIKNYVRKRHNDSIVEYFTLLIFKY
jgi:DDE superfamily endonuclease